MKRVLITGIGMLGLHLADRLTNKGYEVVFLSRSIKPNFRYKVYQWNIKKQYIDSNVFDNTNYIIHLAGANISEGRWTRKRKKELFDSRIQSTNLLFNTLDKENHTIKGYIGASAIGFYGAVTTSKTFTEEREAANDFLGELCYQWEQAHLKFKSLAIPVTIARIGVVLSSEGGAFPKLYEPIKNRYGAIIGNGDQFIPWIHIDDLCDILLKIIHNNESDIYNLVAPESITNRELTKLIAKKLNKMIVLPNIPKPILKILFGEMAYLLLYGSKISSKKVQEKLNYSFKYPEIQNAVENLLKD